MGTITLRQDKESIPFWERIGFRIALGILLPLGFSIYALLNIAGFYGYYTGSFDVYSERKENIERTWASVRIHELSYRVKLAELKYAAERYITGDKRQYRVQVDKVIAEFESELKQAYTLSGDAKRSDSKKIYTSIYGTMKYLREYLDRLEKSSAISDASKAEDARRPILILTSDIEQTLRRLKARFELYELQDQEAVRADYEAIRNNVVSLTIFVLFFGLIICAVVTYTITSPISKVIGRLRDIATGEGDLTKRIQSRTVGEMRITALLMNQFLDNLHEIVFVIRGATETINESVGQVSKQTQATVLSAAEINKNMVTQSMNLEDCSISLSRIDELLQSTSESSRQAASLSRLAMDRALKGGSSVQETVGAMEKIEESAKKVEFLVSTIQGIATQTNLLAINAAIEASKAGEHGKGFAVVAEEVRKLAERSKGLTVEVTDLISEVNSRVKVGSNLARGAGVALDGIIKDVEAVSSLIQRIASASGKQTESSSRLLSAIQLVNQAVRQNLTSMQRVSRGAEVAGIEVEKLDGMMGRLNKIVSQFKLKDFGAGTQMEHFGNYGVTSIPGEMATEEAALDTPYDTDEIRSQLIPAPAPLEEGEGEFVAAEEDLPVDAEGSADTFADEAAEAAEMAAADAMPVPLAVLKSAAPAAPAAAEAPTEEEFVIDAEDEAAEAVANAAEAALARKTPGLVQAPASALAAAAMESVEEAADEAEGFYSADELSKEIRVGAGGKPDSGEDVA